MAKRPRRTAIRIQDVARTAGVSVSTASRVLNNKGDVAEETFARVQRVIEELGYTASLAARSMRSSSTGVLGLVVPEVSEAFCIEVIRGVGEAIGRTAYDLLIYSTNKPATTRATWEREHVALLNNGLTDGTIVAAAWSPSYPVGSPVVVVDPHGQGGSVPSIVATNRIGASEAMHYLLDLEHRRIGFIAGRSETQSAGERFQGYHDSLATASIPFDLGLVRQGDYTRSTARDCARELLSLAQRPSAIFCANDSSALGVLDVVGEFGLRVPDDLSLIGFDNIPETAEATPRLTTVDQSIRTMGSLAVELLVAQLRGEIIEPMVRQVPTRLVVRDSCRRQEL